jgi:hypothetical protein
MRPLTFVTPAEEFADLFESLLGIGDNMAQADYSESTDSGTCYPQAQRKIWNL